MTDRITQLFQWLEPKPPATDMLVYDRFGACLGRVSEVRSDGEGRPQELLIAPTLAMIFAGGRARTVDAQHCRVRANEIHTSYCAGQLAGAAAE